MPTTALPTTIRVYSTLTKEKTPFETVRPGKVGIYLCGPTVYKPSHIGHMVGPVIFDTIKRFLRYCGYEVTLVINVTDVDDKLINESRTRGISMAALAQEMTDDYMRNLQAMGVDTVDHFPRATLTMDGIISFTKGLIDKGFAYASEGDVYFDVAKDREYGKLSNRSIKDMQGEGGEMADRKRSPYDFALWKSAKPGEPSWPSPWGNGRPGWHIECSAMSHAILGETFDIHGGGLDLVFPHHENEIAQSECFHGRPQARYWLHNGLMQAADEAGKVGGRQTRPTAGDIESQMTAKISKSDPPATGVAGAERSVVPAVAAPTAGDFDSQQAGKISKSKGSGPFSELLKHHSPEAIRMLLISTHYRSPILFSEGEIRTQAERLETFYRFFKRYQRVTGEEFYTLSAPATRAEGDALAGGASGGSDALIQQLYDLRARFLDRMDDDFNTAGAIGCLFEAVNALNRYVEVEKLETEGKSKPQQLAALKRGAAVLRELGNVLGLFRAPPAKTAGADDALANQVMQLLIDLRAEARKSKNFALADRIRNGLTAIGITLEDRAGGTEWTRAG